METAEKKKIPRVAQLRITGEKFGLRVWGSWRRFNSERRNFFAAAVKPERFPGLQAFFFGGEDDSSGISQNAILGPRPIKPFLQMLEWERFLEPRVEHAVRENKIRNR